MDTVEIREEMIKGKRHYHTPSGTFKSVTTILSEKLDKSGLEKWRMRVGDEEADRVMRVANIRGTAIHNICEKYVMNDITYSQNQKSLNMETFSRIKRVLDDHVDNIRGIELPLYNKTLKTAGRTDLVAEFDQKLSIIDYKTSTKKKDEKYLTGYFIQATVYSLMYEWIYKEPVEQFVILITCDTGDIQVLQRDRKEFIPKAMEIFCQGGR